MTQNGSDVRGRLVFFNGGIATVTGTYLNGTLSYTFSHTFGLGRGEGELVLSPDNNTLSGWYRDPRTGEQGTGS